MGGSLSTTIVLDGWSRNLDRDVFSKCGMLLCWEVCWMGGEDPKVNGGFDFEVLEVDMNCVESAAPKVPVDLGESKENSELESPSSDRRESF